jgi:ArsR family transcriptional regulator, lead/cadmium/zinc/bismuth-responsive transcriptional repressor
MKKESTCLRIFANEDQINSCKRELEVVREPISRLSRILNLAGNEVRFKILYLLKEEGEMCPCDLSDVLNMTVPAISQHLRKMKDGGVIKDNKIGQTVFYKIVEEQIQLLNPLFSKVKNGINNLKVS